MNNSFQILFDILVVELHMEEKRSLEKASVMGSGRENPVLRRLVDSSSLSKSISSQNLDSLSFHDFPPQNPAV